jgi:hypothetical protein
MTLVEHAARIERTHIDHYPTVSLARYIGFKYYHMYIMMKKSGTEKFNTLIIKIEKTNDYNRCFE